MSVSENPLGPIPAAWRRAVIDALASGDTERVVRVARARNEWSATFPDAWEYQWNEAFIAALEVDSITGRHITDMKPPCDAYAFWFTFDQTQLYGKIGLLPNGTVIIVFSSHIPMRGDQL